MLAIFQNRKSKTFNCPISDCLRPNAEPAESQSQPTFLNENTQITTHKNQASTDSLESWTLFKVGLIHAMFHQQR